MTKIKLSILVMLTLLTSCSDFKQKGKPLFKDLTTLYHLSLKKCKTTHQVWSTAIFDNEYALSTSTSFGDYYVSDFNVAIYRMEQEPTVKKLNKKIDSLSSVVEKNVKKISDKKNESYDKLLSLYTNVIELSKNAKSPTGNLQSFANYINQKESQINMLITEIKARNPDFEK